MNNFLELLSSNRMKSLYWRSSMMVIAGVLTTVIDNGAELNLPSWVAIVLGLVAGEISKHLNTK